jgi:hypothetical protein
VFEFYIFCQSNEFVIVFHRIAMGQAVVSCLQTIGAGSEGANTVLDPLGIVIEEVHITEEVQWEQQEVPFHTQPEHIPFSQLCRVCALETENLVSVFGEEGTELQLVGKIHWHLPIEVSWMWFMQVSNSYSNGRYLAYLFLVEKLVYI